MLTAYIPDSHMLTGSLSPAYWTLHPAWALACNLQKPTECKSSAPVCSECFCISLGKQVSFSGQCENEENMLQPLDYHCMFFLFSGNPRLCVALHWAPLSGSVENWKTKKQKPPRCHCRTNTLECHLTETDPAFALLTHQIVYFLQCRPQKQKDTQVMAAQMQRRALKYFKLAMFIYSISCMITH